MISTTISSEANALRELQNNLTSSLESTSFQVSFATLLAEMSTFFRQQVTSCELSAAEQSATFGATCEELTELISSALTAALATSGVGIAKLSTALRAFRNITDQIARIMLTTRINCVTGQSIVASLPSGEQFARLLNEMVEVAEVARVQLDKLSTDTSRVDRAVEKWNMSLV